MEHMLGEQELIVLVNSVVVSVVLVIAGAWFARGPLSVDEPSRRQVVGEAILSFFLGKGRELAHGPTADRVMRVSVPFLATLFLFIFLSNLVIAVPLPVVNRPPTSHFSVTLALALCSVVGTLLISMAVRGVTSTLRGLVWPNPLQWVSTITDTLSLSLRLFGNIAGEYMTVTLVLAVVPFAIPLVLHVLGLIPAFVQALVFTLLTTSYLAHSLHEEESRSSKEQHTASVATVEGGTHSWTRS